MGDAAISARSKENHLIFPGIRTKWPPVAEHYGLPFSPVLIINIYRLTLFCTDSDVAHLNLPFLLMPQCGNYSQTIKDKGELTEVLFFGSSAVLTLL
jgi:hypothetical protein